MLSFGDATSYEHLATERSYVEKMDDGQDAQCYERIVPLPNGAKLIQKLYTFTTETFKDVAGWKLVRCLLARAILLSSLLVESFFNNVSCLV